LNVYPATYLEKHEVREQTFTNRLDALTFRDELKKQGFTVTWKRWDLTDLARCYTYEVRGVKERG